MRFPRGGPGTRSKTVIWLLGAAMVVGLAGSAGSAVNIFVDSTADAVDANPGDGRCATAGNACTLRAAVMEANALAAAGTSTYNAIFVPPGTYTLAIAGRGEDAAATGDLDLNGGNLTILGADATLDANGLDRYFDLGPLSPVNFSLEGVTIVRGNAVSTPPNTGTSGPDIGGGIRILKDSGLEVSRSVLRDNHAGARGGAIGMPATASTAVGANPNIVTALTHVTIEGNTAGVEAGALFNNRVAILRRVAILGNRVTGTAATDRGAGIANSGDLTVDESLVHGNTMASGNAGGIGNRGDFAANIFGTIRVTNSTVSENVAGQGGGIGNGPGATAIVSNSTVSGNRAVQAGGGMINAGTATVSSSTFSGNAAPAGGGIATFGPPPGAPNASLTLRTTVLNHGAAGGNCLLPPAPVPFARAPISGGDNISSDGSCNLAGPGDRNGVNPLLGPLADNGGPTPTHALLPGSPAIDAVLNNACPPPDRDQRGVPRPQRGTLGSAPLCDIGAFEVSRGGRGFFFFP